MSVASFPESFERNIDFIPSFSIQERITPRAEMCYVTARTSKSKTTSEAPDKIGNLRFTRKIVSGTGIDLAFGDPEPDSNPSNMECSTAPELLEDLRNAGFEDATIGERIMIHKNPKDLQHLLPFQEYDHLYEMQVASVRRPGMIRRMLKMYVWNPYPMLKAELFKAGVIKNFRDPALKRLQSGLVTDWIKPCHPQLGWSHFGRHQSLLMQTLSMDLATKRRFWLDTGVPIARQLQFNQMNINLRLFELVKNKEPIAFKLPDHVV